MKQFILIFSMAFLSISAFAQNTKTKVNAPVSISNGTDKQATDVKTTQPQAKPKLEKRTLTVTKRRYLTGDVKAEDTPSVSDDFCTALSIESTDNTLTISNFKAAHTNMEVYKVRGDGGWTQIFSCNNNCGEQATVKVEAQKKYVIHVKMFDADWKIICDKNMPHTASGEATDTETPPTCAIVTVSSDENGLTVANVKAPHSHVDIYRVRADGGWESIYMCNDNCKETITAKANTQYKHIVHVKLFSESWQLVSEKNIEYIPE